MNIANILFDFIVALITGAISSIFVSKIFFIYEESIILLDRIIDDKLVATLQADYYGMKNPTLVAEIYNNKVGIDYEKYYKDKIVKDIALASSSNNLVTIKQLPEELRSTKNKYDMGMFNLKLAAMKAEYGEKEIREQLDNVLEAQEELRTYRKNRMYTYCIRQFLNDDLIVIIMYSFVLLILLYISFVEF